MLSAHARRHYTLGPFQGLHRVKAELSALLTQALMPFKHSGRVTELPSITVERTRQREHGDFASNIALVLAKPLGLKPRELAQQIVAALPPSPLVARTEIAGAGFINFFLSPSALPSVVPTILRGRRTFGRNNLGRGERVMIEFVSANPNGPLHVGHGRGAAYGDSLARLLDACGYRVHREYYVNDAGRQMDILAASVWLRYLDLCGEKLPFPANGYQGEYVIAIAAELKRIAGDALRRSTGDILFDLPPDEPQGGDKDVYVDALIARMQRLLGPADYRRVHGAGLEAMLADIRDDLAQFGVAYDRWFSERSLADSGAVARAIDTLKRSDHVYEKDGALWFRSTAFGDEKDRVVVRDNGVATYFASDIAYHLDKFERGFSRCIDIWGADHHGYIPRVRAALTALGRDATRLSVLLVQFVILYRGAERAQMSTRSGQFVTLRELREEVGNDAARFFYVLRKSEQHMDFDLELAKSRSNDNPVFYIQYAHARVCSVFRQLQEKRLSRETELERLDLARLQETHETDLLNMLWRYTETLEEAARAHEPHQLAYYLRDLANALHSYYNAHAFLVEDERLRSARLALIDATRQVLGNGLSLLGVAAPESM